MLRLGKIACLIAPNFPAILLTNEGLEGQTRIVVWLKIIGDDKEIKLPSEITFDQAIEMIEESAQANLNQAVTLLAGKLKGPWKAKEGGVKQNAEKIGYSGA